MWHADDGKSHDSYDSSGSSDESSSSSTGTEHAPIRVAQHHNQADDDDVPTEQLQVKQWTIQITIGLGLCPWAAKSHNQGNLRYVTCTSEIPQDVVVCVEQEIHRLINMNHKRHPWSTTLVVCPFVKEWNQSFTAFDRFVSRDIWDKFDDDEIDTSISDEITLVAFHPNFLRWHSLPDNITIGSTVQSHYGYIGKKSVETATATIVETCNKAFGMRRVKVRFHEEETHDGAACTARRKEQYVPTDWISIDSSNICEDDQRGGTATSQRGPALPDNAMHQAPHPTIHIINNADLASLSIRDISRVKRKNAHRMMKLGWDGLEKQLGLKKE